LSQPGTAAQGAVKECCNTTLTALASEGYGSFWLSMRRDRDFIQLWPQLSRHKKSISGRVIRNTVQNGISTFKLVLVDDST